MMSEEKTIFARIVDGELPSEKIYEDEHAIVIKDINPQAPTHVLIIPRATDIPRLVDANESHQALLGHLLLVAGKVSKQLGVDDAFRLVINNGAEAVSLAEEEPFDLILMDLAMPEMDGIEATRAIRSGHGANRDTRIVAITANAFGEDRERCFAAGMNVVQ